MKLTLSWLKQYLRSEATAEQVCATLTDIGLEVESCEDQAKSLSYFSVAKIIEAKMQILGIHVDNVAWWETPKSRSVVYL